MSRRGERRTPGAGRSSPSLPLARELGLREALAGLVAVRLDEGAELRGVEAAAGGDVAVAGVRRRAGVRLCGPRGQRDPGAERPERGDDQPVRVAEVPRL